MVGVRDISGQTAGVGVVVGAPVRDERRTVGLTTTTVEGCERGTVWVGVTGRRSFG